MYPPETEGDGVAPTTYNVIPGSPALQSSQVYTSSEGGSGGAYRTTASAYETTYGQAIVPLSTFSYNFRGQSMTFYYLKPKLVDPALRTLLLAEGLVETP